MIPSTTCRARSPAVLPAVRLGLVAAVVSLLSCDQPPHDVDETVGLPVYVEQAVPERIWTHREFRPVEVDAALSEGWWNPQQLRVRDGDVYVADVGFMHLRRFTLDGEPLNTIGFGRGEGPGELIHITDFFVRDGDVWIVDLRRRTVSRFTTEGAYVSRFHPEADAFRITGFGDDLVLMVMASFDLFQRVDASGRVLETFGKSIAEQTNNFLVLDGTLTSVAPGSFVFAPFYVSRIYQFEEERGLTRVIETMDRVDFADLGSGGVDGGVVRAPNPDVRTRDVSLDEGTLYVHTYFRGTDEGDVSALDRFDWTTGSYVSTTRLPHPVAQAQVHGGRLYTLRDTTVAVYAFE